MFTGQYQHNLDTKNRLTLPSKLAEALSTNIYLSKGFDECLEIRTEAEFNKYSEKLLSYSSNSNDVRKIQRVFFSMSSKIEIDSNKRILIPTNLLEISGITKAVILVGVGETIEVWDEEKFKKYLNEATKQYEIVAEKIAGGKNEK
ncbi:MAG: division/cell wall cluster transcriptional repressor MraZ [Mycoplasmataceae bacterium]|nr:division/cell wall cluster transcriptional repressor MraZ [Mycoplasmataceae bacterium]